MNRTFEEETRMKKRKVLERKNKKGRAPRTDKDITMPSIKV
jgi:hypothetical protein